MTEIFHIISLPILTGLILFLFPERLRSLKGLLTIIVSLITFYLAAVIFGNDKEIIKFCGLTDINILAYCRLNIIPDADHYVLFTVDNLSKLIIIFISLFACLISLYSIVYITPDKKIPGYYPYFLITVGASFGAVLSDNLLLFIIFWGILGITLYRLIRGYDELRSAAAKKTFIIIGASDGIMILGVAIIWKMTGTLSITEISLPTTNALSITAFFALLIGSFAKAGAFPFHSWIPDYVESAPAASSALLPASLDKLLGIYFLARITTKLFVMNEWLTLVLLTTGVITIITAVMMALIQHNYKKLLGFHAVSQVGYMVVGFGLGSVIGIAAGLFHMINHAIYKGGLILAAGAVEKHTGKSQIEDLGGLSKAMPVTFGAALIFALSISGIPPFNGFASKWMIYQGIIEFGAGNGIASRLWIIWLGLAVLGSALTLASFIKFIGGIFLGPRKPELTDVREVKWPMSLPLIILALLCATFGIFAINIVVPGLIMPVTGEFLFTGLWNSTGVSILILVSIVLGVLIYLAGKIKNLRSSDSFIGGEIFRDETGFATTEYYKTFMEFSWLEFMYRKSEQRWFDIYEIKKKGTLWLNNIFSNAHTGLLTDYTLWVLAGIIIMMMILI